MKSVLKNGLNFLSYPQGDILSAGFVIMVLSVVSGVFGLLRDRLLATNFTPDLVGIYFAAFVIPDTIIRILILSAAGAAFIPVFTKYQRDGTHWELARSILHVSLLAFLVIVVLVLIFLEPLSFILVSGIQKEDPRHMALFINLTRTILFAQSFFVISYLFTGILQSYQRFLVPAATAAFYNIGIIVGLLFFAPRFGMYGVIIGVVLGALLHLLIQVPSVLRLGFSYRLPTRLFHPGVGEIAHLMAPRALSIGIEQVKLVIDTALASIISLASITFLNFATHVAIFPVSLFAAAIGQAALPFLARAAANNNMEEFKKQMTLSLTHIAFFLTPASVLLIVLHTPLVRLIFGAPRFSWEATFLTSWTLAFLSIGLFAQGAGIVLARGFYALFDTKTPLVMTSVSLTSSILFALLFVLYFNLPVWSLGLSTTIGMLLNAILLFVLLDKKVGGFPRFTLMLSLLKILLISLFLGIFSYALFKLLEGFFNTNYGLPLLLFTTLVTVVSGLFYILLSFVFNLEEYQAIFMFFKKAARVRQKFFGPQPPLVDEHTPKI